MIILLKVLKTIVRLVGTPFMLAFLPFLSIDELFKRAIHRRESGLPLPERRWQLRAAPRDLRTWMEGRS